MLIQTHLFGSNSCITLGVPNGSVHPSHSEISVFSSQTSFGEVTLPHMAIAKLKMNMRIVQGSTKYTNDT